MVLLDDSWEVVIALVQLLGSQLTLMVLLTFSRLHWKHARELLSVLL
jgi:hypothetical protein